MTTDENNDTPLPIKRVALVIDDEPFNADIAKEIVSEFGLEVHTAFSADIAMDICFKFLVQNKRIDLILLDYNMPDTCGDKLASILREPRFDPILMGTPIIGVTANNDAQTKKKCLDAGMNRVYGKPFSIVQIKEILQEYSLI